jgi:hypothetical protein
MALRIEIPRNQGPVLGVHGLPQSVSAPYKACL